MQIFHGMDRSKHRKCAEVRGWREKVCNWKSGNVRSWCEFSTFNMPHFNTKEDKFRSCTDWVRCTQTAWEIQQCWCSLHLKNIIYTWWESGNVFSKHTNTSIIKCRGLHYLVALIHRKFTRPSRSVLQSHQSYGVANTSLWCERYEDGISIKMDTTTLFCLISMGHTNSQIPTLCCIVIWSGPL